MSLYTLSPLATQQFIDPNGAPYAGGKLYTYVVGTSTPATTYSMPDGTPHANPITLSPGGWIATSGGTISGLYLAATSYDFVLKDSAGVTIWGPITVGAISLEASGVFEVFSFGGDDDTPIVATSYPSGATYDKCHAGTTWLTIDSANIAAGTYKLTGMLLSGDGIVTVTAALVNLTDGAPDTPLATMTSTSGTGAQAFSGVITFATAGTTKQYAIKVKVSAGYGLAWGFALAKVG